MGDKSRQLAASPFVIGHFHSPRRVSTARLFFANLSGGEQEVRLLIRCNLTGGAPPVSRVICGKLSSRPAEVASAALHPGYLLGHLPRRIHPTSTDGNTPLRRN